MVNHVMVPCGASLLRLMQSEQVNPNMLSHTKGKELGDLGERGGD